MHLHAALNGLAVGSAVVSSLLLSQLGHAQEAQEPNSFRFSRHYIRHADFKHWLGKSDGSTLFRKDATFIISRPLTVYPPSQIIDHGTNLIPAD